MQKIQKTQKKQNMLANYTMQKRKVQELRPHPKNPRIHEENNVQGIMASIGAHGYVPTVIIGKLSGFILSGHGTIEALKRLGVPEIDVKVVDIATPEKELSFIIAANATTDSSRFDDDALATILQQLDKKGIDLRDTAITDVQIQSLLVGQQGPESFGVVDENLETEHRCPKCGYEWSGGN